MPRRSAGNALQNSTAPEDVRQTPTISREIFWIPMMWAASFKKNV